MVHAVMTNYKIQQSYFVVVFAIVLQQTFAGTFPESIKKCKVSDSNFDDCVLNSANDLLPTVINGNDKYGIPPLRISHLTRRYNFTQDFGMKFTDLTVHTNGELVITDIHFDFQKEILTFTAEICRLLLTANYTTVGNFPGIPSFCESGIVNMTFENVEFIVSMPFHFKTVEAKRYLEAVSCKLVVNGRNFLFRPLFRARIQTIPGYKMTKELFKGYLTEIDKIPELMKSETEHLDKELVEALNKIFELLLFEELFLP
ncbi:hypothetical protein CBL_08265 [Carabus blaptoides fortunei]